MSNKSTEKELKKEGEVEIVESIPQTDSNPEEEVKPEVTEDLSVIESTKTKAAKNTKQAKSTKKQEEEVQPEEPEKIADPVMDRVFDPKKTYKFVSKTAGFRKMIPSRAVVWDEVTGQPKEIVLTDTEESPYAEDHSESVKPSRKQLALFKGELLVKGTDLPTLRYLLAYDGFAGKQTVMPSNKKVKGLYDLEDPDQLQEAAVALEKKKVQAKKIVLEAAVSEVEDFVLSRGKEAFGNAAIIEGIKLANIAPDLVIQNFENPVVKVKADLIRARYKGLLSVDGEKVLDPKGKVLFVAAGRDALEEAAKEVLAETPKSKALSLIIAEL